MPTLIASITLALTLVLAPLHSNTGTVLSEEIVFNKA